jgi:hypothetical protein
MKPLKADQQLPVSLSYSVVLQALKSKSSPRRRRGVDVSTERGLTERSGEVFLLDILSHRTSAITISRLPSPTACKLRAFIDSPYSVVLRFQHNDRPDHLALPHHREVGWRPYTLLRSKAVLKILGVLLLCGGLADCGSSAANLTGSWQFTFKSSANGNTYTGTASITQGGFVNSLGSGTEHVVTGTVNFANAPCATAAPLSGTISGLNVILTVTEATESVSLTGNVNTAFTAMSGTYAAPLGGCTAGDFGSWAASKS